MSSVGVPAFGVLIKVQLSKEEHHGNAENDPADGGLRPDAISRGRGLLRRSPKCRALSGFSRDGSI